MRKEIIKRTYPDTPAELEALNPLLQRIYAARHIQSMRELDRGLNQLLPYQTLSGIHEAVIVSLMLLCTIRQFSLSVILMQMVQRALRLLFARYVVLVCSVHYLVPNRFAYGYGLTPELVAAAKAFTPDVIVTVDNGIANHAGVEAAKALGITVIITDHHLPAVTLPSADAIVNPNQTGDPFPSKCLAGVGVIFYVMLALRRRLADLGWFEKKQLPQPKCLALDLVALGTVADLVPLDYNNRILVHQGLRRIRAGQCVSGIVSAY